MKRLGKKWSICDSRHPTSELGFTLIELLVAMAILMVIVLMMASLFKQSTLAWESGTRQAEVGLEARAVIAMIQHELSQAVADSTLSKEPFIASGNTLSFYTLGEALAGARQVKHVEYVGGGTLQKTTALVKVSPYDGSLGTSETVVLLDNVTVFNIKCPPGFLASAMNLPDWVDVRLELSKESEISEVEISSLGRDKVAGTKDDDALHSWRKPK